MDILQTLLEDLRSPDPTIRFSVLSRIGDLEWTEDLKNTFQNLLLQEKDPTTRFHMQKVLASVQRDPNQTPEQVVAEIETLLKDPHRDELSLALLLENVKRSQGPLLVMAFREANWTSFSPHVLPSILAIFKRFGSFEDTADIEALCRHPDPRVLSSAVEALEKLSPDRLKDLIVPLLVNPVHGIRSRAVRLLYRWDPAEALRHFEAMLFSEDPGDRSAALFHAFFFPFPKIEPLMLRFLGIESEPAMLNKAGYLFRANPAPEEPLRLLEVREVSRGEKRTLIEGILKGVIQSLHQAGLVDKTPEQLLTDLAALYRRRKAIQLIERCELALNSSDPDNRKAAALKLGELAGMGFSDARRSLEAYVPNETNEDVRRTVQALLEAEPEKPATPAGPKDPLRMEAEELRAYLVRLTTEELPVLRKALPSLLGRMAPPEKEALLQSLPRIGTKKDAALLQRFLKDPDPRILALTIKGLHQLDPDVLVPFLPQLIQHADDEVRAGALEVFALFDKKQALALVEKMLYSMKPKQRRLAIFSAGQIDFPSVRDILLAAVQREQDPENVQQTCAIFKANIDEELLFRAACLRETSAGKKKELLQTFISEGAAILIRDGKVAWKGLAELETSMRTRMEEEEKKRKEAQPSYSLKNIQKMRQQQAESKEDPGLTQFTVVAFSVGALLTVLIWFVFLKPGPVAKKPPKSAQAAAARLDTSPRNISGKITRVGPGNSFIVVETNTDPPEIFTVHPEKAFETELKHGQQFNGQVKPVSQDKEGVQAQLLMQY